MPGTCTVNKRVALTDVRRVSRAGSGAAFAAAHSPGVRRFVSLASKPEFELTKDAPKPMAWLPDVSEPAFNGKRIGPTATSIAKNITGDRITAVNQKHLNRELLEEKK